MQAQVFGQITFPTTDASVAFAQDLAARLQAGDVLLLSGEIGAGKTFLCRAIVQARLAAKGIYEEVPSPTFTLVQVYEPGDVDIWHCDLYRLSSPDDVLELGLEEAFETAICLVEWPDRLGDLAPRDALHLILSHPADLDSAATQRLLALASHDSAWRDRLAGLLEHSE